MGANSKIEWCHYTFNPWWGCTRVSEGCRNCYAEKLAKRGNVGWGPTAERRMFGDRHWQEPVQWNAAAARAGARRRVFCASMADVFEDRPELVEPRAQLFRLIAATPMLDWQLLTKRPENIKRLCTEEAWYDVLPMCWIGTSVERQDSVERLSYVAGMPGAVHFVSAEPLLGPLDLRPWLGWERAASGTPWVIVGGESGPGARPCQIEWIRDVVRQCRAARVPCFVKQLGAFVRLGAAELELRDRKGGDMSEWPADLRVREFPRGVV